MSYAPLLVILGWLYDLIGGICHLHYSASERRRKCLVFNLQAFVTGTFSFCPRVLAVRFSAQANLQILFAFIQVFVYHMMLMR